MNRSIYMAYHRFIKRDILGRLRCSKFAQCGKDSIIFKPIITDRNRHFITIGNNVTIGKYARMNCYPNRNKERNNLPEIIISDGCNIGQRFSILAGGRVYIGKGVLIASDVLVTSENHSTDPECRELFMDQPLVCKDVIIKEGCWIGEKVIILPGVTIGEKSIIGAGSVVTKNVPDYSIAVGNPAKVIKEYSFEMHQWEAIK